MYPCKRKVCFRKSCTKVCLCSRVFQTKETINAFTTNLFPQITMTPVQRYVVLPPAEVFCLCGWVPNTCTVAELALNETSCSCFMEDGERGDCAKVTFSARASTNMTSSARLPVLAVGAGCLDIFLLPTIPSFSLFQRYDPI